MRQTRTCAIVADVLSTSSFETNNLLGVQAAPCSLLESVWSVIRQHSSWVVNERCNETNRNLNSY
jgi:hypothetical protein